MPKGPWDVSVSRPGRRCKMNPRANTPSPTKGHLLGTSSGRTYADAKMLAWGYKGIAKPDAHLPNHAVN
eukprot:7612687-Alexandrium_andersonii.AAC.1